MFALVAALQAAGPPAPIVSFDPATDFTPYRSYKWVFAHPPGGIDPSLYRQVHAAVDRSLNKHGFGQSDYGEFAVAFTLGPREKAHATDYGHYAPYYRGEAAAEHKKWVNDELANLSTHQNTLAIDVYDTYTKRPVWHGVAPIPIMPNAEAAIVDQEVEQVLSLFPPKQ